MSSVGWQAGEDVLHLSSPNWIKDERKGWWVCEIKDKDGEGKGKEKSVNRIKKQAKKRR